MDKVRFFVITAGRSGSTLLCSVLRDAGAEFGLDDVTDWDETGGAFEHPDLWRSSAHYYRSHKMSSDRPGLPAKWMWDLHRWRGKTLLKRGLEQARYLKAINIDLTVQPAFKLGYFPQIIISARAFADQQVSLATMFTERSAIDHEREYLRTYRNGLLWLRLYGGCVIDFDSMTHPSGDFCAPPLAALTGLPAAALARALEQRRRDIPHHSHRATAAIRRSLGIENLEAELDSLRGMVIPPSGAARRAWRKRHGTTPIPELPQMSAFTGRPAILKAHGF